MGMRYRLGSRLPGRPDFVFSRHRIAVFVDGCFWHGCPLHYQAPKSRAEFWRRKLVANRTRDQRIDAALSVMGWRVLRFWEHEVIEDLHDAAARIRINCVSGAA